MEGRTSNSTMGLPRVPANFGSVSSFGDIAGIEVGKHWDSRRECSLDFVHRPTMAGIHGTKDNGAYSIALSGLYDNEDNGETFVYSGAGGRQRFARGQDGNIKRLRVGAQNQDQTWDNTGNRSLLVSMQTRLPVRVIRSANLRSIYAPTEGKYRYDGLYKVVDAWKETGNHGFAVCKYKFERIPGQPPLPLHRHIASLAHTTNTRKRSVSSADVGQEGQCQEEHAQKRQKITPPSPFELKEVPKASRSKSKSVSPVESVSDCSLIWVADVPYTEG